MKLTNRSLVTAAAISISLGTLSQGSILQGPVALTGWNQDIIAEKTAASPAAGTSTDVVSWSWYEVGAPGSTQGLPSSGLITSSYGSLVQFQLQPYTSNNAILLKGDGNTASLTLTTPGKFQSLQFLNSAQGIPGTVWNAKLNFSDASSTTLSTVSDVDWTINSANNARTANGLAVRANPWGSYYTGTLNLFEHDFTLSGADQAKMLQSITFTKISNGPLQFFGLSGAQIVVPEPSTIMLLALGGLGMFGWVKRNRKNPTAI